MIEKKVGTTVPVDLFALPLAPVPITHINPKLMVIFSKPKTGKTSLFAQLDNFLILDLEKGSDFVSGLKLKANSIEDIQKIGNNIKLAGYPYKGIIVDTCTALEDMCIPYAEQIYSKTSMGKNWFKANAAGTGYADDSGKKQYGSILNMPMGAGYPFLREAFFKIIEYIKTWAPHIILSGHVKDILVDKGGKEFNALDLNLTGKIKGITCAQSDAIGYLFRKGNQNILTFKTTDDITCGARPDHLKNAEIVVSELVEGKLITHWDQIYLK